MGSPGVGSRESVHGSRFTRSGFTRSRFTRSGSTRSRFTRSRFAGSWFAGSRFTGSRRIVRLRRWRGVVGRFRLFVVGGPGILRLACRTLVFVDLAGQTLRPVTNISLLLSQPLLVVSPFSPSLYTPLLTQDSLDFLDVTLYAVLFLPETVGPILV